MSNNKKGSGGSIWGIIGFALMVLGVSIIVIALLWWLILGRFDVGTSLPMLAMGGWLSNPYRTTRKMKVPYHSRKGHVERNGQKVFEFLIDFTVAAVLVSLIWLAFQH